MKIDKVKLYKTLKEKLEAEAKSKNVGIERYYHPDCEKWSGNPEPPSYFEELCSALQDGSVINGVVYYWGVYEKKKDGTTILVRDKISEILDGFRVQKVLEYENWKVLMNQLCYNLPNRLDKKHFIEDPENPKAKPSMRWHYYAKGIYDGAAYLSGAKQFENVPSLDAIINAKPQSVEDVKTQFFLLRKLWKNSPKISCLGLRSCYNWVKECGAKWVAKPDLHIGAVVDALVEKEYGTWETFLSKHPSYMQFDNETRKPKMEHDERVALYMWEWANEIKEAECDAEMTAFILDRIVFLCHSGKFYKEKISFNPILPANLSSFLDGFIES